VSGPLNRAPGQVGAISWLGAAYVAFALYLLLPLTMVVLMSFKDHRFMGFPITRWTTQWYADAIRDQQFLNALSYSLVIAFISTAIALVMGLWLALLLSRQKLYLRGLLFALVCMPIVVPGIVSAISLRIFVETTGIDTGPVAIIIAHAAHSAPFITLMAMTRLSSMPAHLTESARDLGADAFVAFTRVTLPYLRPALIGGCIFAMLSSFDDFIRSFFLASFAPTLPILIFARLRDGLSPSLAAISTMVLIVTVLIGAFAERFVRTRRMR
jgi:spermidine/putrescine transport system permease protein